MKARPLSALLLILTFTCASAIAGSAEDTAFETKAKAALTRNFYDPASAQFRGLFLVDNPKGPRVLCGEVNAKNVHGAYIGFRRFYWANDTLGDIGNKARADDAKWFEKIYSRVCARRPT